MKKQGILGLITASAVLFSMTGSFPVSAQSNEAGEMRDISTMELVRDMGIGINLGNTMDACGDWIAHWGDGTTASYETAWGSPVITQEMIQGYADEGFGVLRIPTAWSNMMVQDGTYQINEEWMARVTQIVDWALDADLYVIVNIHWDNGWVNTFPDNKDECMKRYETMWSQICENFKDYSDYLMFESQNEELGWESVWNKWQGDNGKAESYQLVNEINQKFVDTVRSSGGNNSKRHLLISGYNTGIDVTCDSMFQMPYDPENRCAVSVHYYTPAGFAILEEDASWGTARSTWGTDEDYEELNSWMEMMKTNFVDKGIPVIIGEYGCPSNNKDADSVRLFLSSVCRAAYERNLCPILWDVTGFQYDRENCRLYDPLLKQAYQDIVGVKQVRMTGDINDDGSVNIADMVILRSYLLYGGNMTKKQAKYADCCDDGVIDSLDMTVLRQMILS
jgi:endoglucanase